MGLDVKFWDFDGIGFSTRCVVFVKLKPPALSLLRRNLCRFRCNASLILLGISFVMGRHFEALVASGEIVGGDDDDAGGDG